jgi:uncharacterized membrane protein YdjX (TVP38/TMEM64 family)
MTLSAPLDTASPRPSSPPRHRWLVRLLRSRGLAVLLVVGASGWLLLAGLEALGGPEALRGRFGLAAAAVLVPVHAVVAVSPFPSELIAPVHGAIYGFAVGWPLTWLGWWLGAALEYGLYRRVARDLLEGEGGRLPSWLRRLPAAHPLFLVFGRLVPFGNHAVNALAGSCRVPLWRFAWTSALAFLPFSALVAGVASGLVRW